jgi:hypothetical protein
MTNGTDVRWWHKCCGSDPTLAFLIIGGGVLIAGFLAGAMWLFHQESIGPELKLPLVVIFGVVILLMAIGLLVFSFSQLNLASPAQALGLPDGSVRSIIALMLLVLFTIVAIFLYNSVATSGALQSVKNVSSADLDTMRKHVTVVVATADPGKETTGPFMVYFRNSNLAGEDIAKQLIILLGTLVTAVASFYFGANSVASAHEAILKASAVTAAPILTGLTPVSVKRGAGPMPVKIFGANLGRVTNATFVRNGKLLDTTLASVSDTEIACTVTSKTDSDPGKYDLALFEGNREVARKPQAFEVVP